MCSMLLAVSPLQNNYFTVEIIIALENRIIFSYILQRPLQRRDCKPESTFKDQGVTRGQHFCIHQGYAQRFLKSILEIHKEDLEDFL